MTQLTPAVTYTDHVSGDEFAQIELVEYGDYECPHCGHAYPIVKDIQQQLGSGIRFAFRNFPLRKIHPHAFSAAVATEAAGLQHKFWEMHDIIFENQGNLSIENILQLADEIDLDPDRINMDMRHKDLIDKVEKDFDSGIRSGVNSTPTFYINGEKFTGDWQNGELLQTLKNLLTSIIFS